MSDLIDEGPAHGDGGLELGKFVLDCLQVRDGSTKHLPLIEFRLVT